MPENVIARMPADDGQPTSAIDLGKVRQLRPFKIDYQHVRHLQYVDRDGRAPQGFAEFLSLVPPAAMQVEEQPRPGFSTDLRYLRTYSVAQFPKGKVLVLVNGALFPSVKAGIGQYVKDLAYEGYFAIVVTITGGTPSELRAFIARKRPLAGVLLVGALPTAWFEMDDDFKQRAQRVSL